MVKKKLDKKWLVVILVIVGILIANKMGYINLFVVTGPCTYGDTQYGTCPDGVTKYIIAQCGPTQDFTGTQWWMGTPMEMQCIYQCVPPAPCSLKHLTDCSGGCPSGYRIFEDNGPCGSHDCLPIASNECASNQQCWDRYKSCYYICSANKCQQIYTITALCPYPNCGLSPPNCGIACPQDVKSCPDGSYVSRVAPNCDFAPCPGGTCPIGYHEGTVPPYDINSYTHEIITVGETVCYRLLPKTGCKSDTDCTIYCFMSPCPQPKCINGTCTMLPTLLELYYPYLLIGGLIIIFIFRKKLF